MGCCALRPISATSFKLFISVIVRPPSMVYGAVAWVPPIVLRRFLDGWMHAFPSRFRSFLSMAEQEINAYAVNGLRAEFYAAIQRHLDKITSSECSRSLVSATAVLPVHATLNTPVERESRATKLTTTKLTSSKKKSMSFKELSETLPED